MEIPSPTESFARYARQLLSILEHIVRGNLDRFAAVHTQYTDRISLYARLPDDEVRAAKEERILGLLDRLEERQAAFEAMDRLEAAYPAGGPAEVASARDALATVRTAHADARSLVPPAKYAAIHGYFVTGLDLYEQAGAIMEAHDFAELDGEALEEATELLERARDAFLQALDAVDALESVWGSK